MPKEKTVQPARPNLGLEAAYREKLERLIERMNASVQWWILAAYKQNTPEMAQDAVPAKALQSVLKRLRKQWQGEFDEAAPDVSSWFAENSRRQTDRSFAVALKKAGFSVKFDLTPETRDILHATIGENVSLIKSISSEYFTDVEGAVMRATAAGRDVGTLAAEIENTYGVTKRRAAFISRDQLNKSTANVTRARQQQLGITRAIWVHSRGGRHPRPSHVAANGRKYLIAEGCEIDGKKIFPGELFNCRCVCKSILPALDDGSD
jgi:uncharacterized protein with gpF-like domain